MKKILFLLLFVSPSLLHGVDHEEEIKEYVAQWHLTHLIRLGEEVKGREVVCMHPKRPQSEQEEKLNKLIEEIMNWKHNSSSCKRETCCLRPDSVGGPCLSSNDLFKKLERLEGELKQEKFNQKLLNMLFHFKNHFFDCAKEGYQQLKKSNQEEYLQTLKNDEALKPGLCVRTNKGVLRISILEEKCYLGYPGKEFPPRNLDFSGNYPDAQEVDCTQRFEQEKVELMDNDLVIGNAEEFKMLLSDLSKKQREIVDSVIFGHKNGDKVAVLFNTGECAVFSKTENNGKSIIIESDYLKKQTTVASQDQLVSLERQMQEAATRLDFAKAISLREQWYQLKQQVEK